MDPMFHIYEMFLGVGRSTSMLFISTRMSFFRLCVFICVVFILLFLLCFVDFQ